MDNPTRLPLLLAVIAGLAGAGVADDPPPAGDPLAALAFLVGEFEGDGQHPFGAYRETFTGRWILDGTALEVRSESRAGAERLFHDLRVFSFDAGANRLRLRQWAEGRLREYSGAAAADGKLVFAETAQEGPASAAWRYTFAPQAAGGFDYTVHVAGQGAEPFVRGALRVRRRDPGAAGGLPVRQYDAEAAGMAAQVHHPEATGAYPLLVFAPGGDAATAEGYEGFGRWFASWGVITVIVAFDDASADARAPKMARVIDWALAEGTREGSPLHGRLDPERIGLAGHSRGGHAALLAGRADRRVDAVLALAPSGPAEPAAGDGTPAVCIVIGGTDEFLEPARRAYEHQSGERVLIEVEGLTHMLGPRDPVLKLVARSTAFLNVALRGDAGYRAPLVAPGPGLTIRSAPAASARR